MLLFWFFFLWYLQLHQQKKPPFVEIRSSLHLLERIVCSGKCNEPVLFVGETGTGKTTLVQNLSMRIDQKLTVLGCLRCGCSLSLSLSIYLSIYIYIYICICVCVSDCEVVDECLCTLAIYYCNSDWLQFVFCSRIWVSKVMWQIC